MDAVLDFARSVRAAVRAIHDRPGPVVADADLALAITNLTAAYGHAERVAVCCGGSAAWVERRAAVAGAAADLRAVRAALPRMHPRAALSAVRGVLRRLAPLTAEAELALAAG